MISHNLKCIFIHIDKNGGKSVEKAIWNIDPIHGSADHKKMSYWHQKLKTNVFDDYFKFTFCRNPWDRAVSQYHAYVQSSKNHYKIPNDIIQGTFEHFIKSLRSESIRVFAPLQISWLKDLNDKPRIDFVGRFENLEKDWDILCNKLGITKKLPHLNKSKHRDYKIYYTKELIQIVKTIYKEDIDFFKYEF